MGLAVWGFLILNDMNLIPGGLKTRKYNKKLFANTQNELDYIKSKLKTEYDAVLITANQIGLYCLSFEPARIVLKSGEVIDIYSYEELCPLGICVESNEGIEDCEGNWEETEYCNKCVHETKSRYVFYQEEISNAAGLKSWEIYDIPKDAELIVIDYKEYIHRVNSDEIKEPSNEEPNNLSQEELDFLLT